MPHTLKVIDNASFRTIRDNSIIVSGWEQTSHEIGVKKKVLHSLYRSIVYCGKNLKGVIDSQQSNSFTNNIDVSRLKNNTFFILAASSEYNADRNILYTDFDKNPDRGSKDKSHLVVLLAVVYKPSHKNIEPPFFLDVCHEQIRKIKHTSIKKNSDGHFGSRGKYYGFGVHSSFKKITESSQISLEQYGCKGMKAIVCYFFVTQCRSYNNNFASYMF